MAVTNGQTLVAEAAEPAQEPSMEDILASIRRIIASDQHIVGGRTLSPAPKPVAAPPIAPPPASVVPPAARVAPVEPPAAPEPPSAPDYPGDIPNLDDLDSLILPPAALEPQPAAAAGPEPIPPRRETAAHLHPELFPPPDVQEPTAIYDLNHADRVDPAAEAEDLISPMARDSVSSSFHMLADTVLRDPDTIERIARETLRPMLKTWLDENLPSMVERLVRAEIERVARGGRSRG